MEFGPRALGCRSIIGDARSPRMQQKMNVKIKFRESFRPFAPCVLREHVARVLRDAAGRGQPLHAPGRARPRAMAHDVDATRTAARWNDPDLEDSRVGSALDGAGDHARRLFARACRPSTRTARALLPADEALPRADRMSRHRQHQLQHPRRADRLHAGGCLSLFHGHRHGCASCSRTTCC